nr:hypothetical protein [uncultured Cohaesibacter sp.]
MKILKDGKLTREALEGIPVSELDHATVKQLQELINKDQSGGRIATKDLNALVIAHESNTLGKVSAQIRRLKEVLR